MSKAGKQPSNTGKSRVRARRAVALLAAIAACLVAVLIILPVHRETSGPALKRLGEPAAEDRSGTEPETVQPPGPEATQAAGGRRQERPLPRARVAVVIDDVGNSLAELQAFIDFAGPLTLSVLPNLPYSEEAARRVFESGKELLLHLPMEAVNGSDPGPGAILTSQSDEEIRRLLEAGFSQVPLAVGMNNHMGSRATTDERVMNVIMEYLRSKRRLFLDSRTTTETVGAATARAYAVPYLARDVFLDNEPQAEQIQKALESGIEIARTKGSAILIGHVRNPEIVDVIGRLLEELDRSGVELVFISDLLEDEGS